MIGPFSEIKKLGSKEILNTVRNHTANMCWHQNAGFGLFALLKILSSLSAPYPQPLGMITDPSLHLSSGLQAWEQGLTQSHVCSRTRPLPVAMRNEGSPPQRGSWG